MLKTGGQSVRNEAYGNCVIWIKFIDSGSDIQRFKSRFLGHLKVRWL